MMNTTRWIDVTIWGCRTVKGPNWTICNYYRTNCQTIVLHKDLMIYGTINLQVESVPKQKMSTTRNRNERARGEGGDSLRNGKEEVRPNQTDPADDARLREYTRCAKKKYLSR